MTTNIFRKKPVEIEARQFNGQTWGATADALAEWCGGEYETDLQPARPTLRIRTLEGVMEASPGDWIIRGVQGEFYPRKPDIFAATYDGPLGSVTTLDGVEHVGVLPVNASADH